MTLGNEIKLLHGDCFALLPGIADGSVNLVFADLPYMETNNSWDKHFDVERVMKHFERIVTPTGCIACTGSFKFGARLYSILPHLYRYDWVWEKRQGVNFVNANYQPMRNHEFVFIFSKGGAAYNNGSTVMEYHPQYTAGEPYTAKNGRTSTNFRCRPNGLAGHKTVNDGRRHPMTVQYFNYDQPKLHPTQKPLGLLELLIKSYTSDGGLVLDATAGSMTTAVAAINCHRRCICIEMDDRMFAIGERRVKERLQCPTLFQPE